MRREHLLAVSSATLFLSAVLASCHLGPVKADARLASSTGHGVLVAEFYPCGLCDDEYFVLENAGVAPVNLLNWTVSDGEGTLRFTGEMSIGAGARLVISSNSTSYGRAFGRLPDISLDGPEAGLWVSRTGTMRFADTGDSISLLDDDGLEVDYVAYGECPDNGSCWVGGDLPSLRKGEVARRLRGALSLVDTDSAADWMHFREFKYGYTEFAPISAQVGPGMLKAFASPDCGLEAVLEAVESARDSLRLCGYEFSSASVCSAVLHAMASGAEVRILVDGAPAGGMDPQQVSCLSVMAASGAEVKVLRGNVSADAVQHTGPMHAKYIVVDDRELVVLSENFVESGLPSDPLSGNRGWGVCVDDAALAECVANLFDEDSRASRPDVLDWRDDPRFDPGAELAEAPTCEHSPGGLRPMMTSYGSTVTILASPDSSVTGPFLSPLIGASSSVLVEQFQADLLWRDRWTGEATDSPLVSASEDAILRGAEVSVLLDSSWFNLEGNSETAERLNSLSASLAGEARLMDLSGPVRTLHNKGLVMDGRLTVVSSNNWGHSSFARNRELAVLVDSVEVAEYFESVFWTDWEPDLEAPVACAGPDITMEVGESVVVDGGGSWDDRSVARWQWRLEGEGLLESLGDRAEFTASRPGRQTIHLIVQDAWGNAGMDSVTIEVLGRPEMAAGPGWVRLLPSTVALGALSSMLGAALARKVNHRRRSSR